MPDDLFTFAERYPNVPGSKTGGASAEAERRKAARGEAQQWLLDHISYAADECLDWPFGRIPTGYGSVVIGGIRRSANQWMCRFAHGPAPDGKPHSAHSCNRPECVNPKHLRWASVSENFHDKTPNGTQLFGLLNNQAKLTDDDILVAEVLLAKGWGQKRVGVLLGVSQDTIWRVANRIRRPMTERAHIHPNYRAREAQHGEALD